MLDVLHFLFEEDFTATSEDHARSRSGIRDALYKDFYGTTYPYKMKPPKNAPNQRQNADLPPGFDDTLEPIEPFSPRAEQRKNTPTSTTRKQPETKFVAADTVKPVAQSFEGLDVLN